MWFRSRLCFGIVVLTCTLGTFVNADDPKPDPKQCYDCIRDGSNDCDSEKPSKATQCATGYCYTNINDKGLFARGCVKDDDDYVKSRDFCSNRKGKCILCSNQEKCNNHKIVEQKCYKATYSISKPIIMDDTYLEKCVISLENLGCYHLERNDNVEKGCMSNLDDKTRDLYKADKDVEICSRDNCNSMVVRELECYQCSKEKDTNCAEPTALTKTKDCSQLSSSCLIGIDKNGTTHRICGMTEDDAKDKFEKYELCQGKTCNDYVFPKNRLKCLQCQGDSDCELKTPESKKNLKAKVCEIHADKEECYTYFENGGKVYRGCMKDETDSRKACEKGDGKCEKCDTDGCNNKSGAGNAKVLKLLLGLTLTTAVIFGLLK